MPAPSPRAALERVFDVLETLALHPDGLALKDLSAATRIHSSTLSRICGNLVGLGLVRKNSYRIFAVDAGLVYLGIRALDAFRPPPAITRLLEETAATCRAQVALGTRHRHLALYLHRAGRSLDLAALPSPAFYPLHHSNVGLTVLAMEGHAPKDELSILMESHLREGDPKPSRPEGQAQLATLEKIRRNGYGSLLVNDAFNAAFPFRWRDRWYAISLYGKLSAAKSSQRDRIAATCLLRDTILRIIQEKE